MTRIGSLFSGIAGIERGLESVIPNSDVAWQAENDPGARAVLRRHYPQARLYSDVRDVDHEAPPVDIICGGFPCQDISNAGKRAGIDGERSGLWSEYARIVRVLRPRVVFVENVAALLARGLDRVLGDLSALGYDAVWEVFRASDVGAPHRRARLFLLAYSDSGRRWLQSVAKSWSVGPTDAPDDGAELAHADSEAGRRDAWDAFGGDGGGAFRTGTEESGRRGCDVADAAGSRCDVAQEAGSDRSDACVGAEEEGRRTSRGEQPERSGSLADPDCGGQRPSERDVRAGQPDAHWNGKDVADADRSGREGEEWGGSPAARRRHAAVSDQQALADAHGPGFGGIGRRGLLNGERAPCRDHTHGCDCPRCYVHRFPPGPDRIADWDGPQPAVRRGTDGLPVGVRTFGLRAYGNACVPQAVARAWRILVREAVR